MTAGHSMSDDAQKAVKALDQQPLLDAGPSAGTLLRRAREEVGLHIGALSVALKVPVNKLEALEADRIDLLPDAVFARALAASVCRTLKLDPALVLRLLPGQVTPQLQPGIKISTASFDRPGMGWRVPLLSRMPRAVVLTASGLVVAALALLLVPSLDRMKSKFVKSSPDAADTAGTGSVASATDTSVARESVEPASVSGVRGGASDTSVMAAVAPTTAASATAVAAVGTPQVSLSDAPVATAGLVVFKTRGPSWVEVTDASGVVQLRKTMAGGESASASGTLPLSVTVGRADSTDVLVRGKSFDLALLTKDNVARFQIK
jgi:cytoskeleton protein RodZ